MPNLEILGEVTKNLSTATRVANPEVLWARGCPFAHSYVSVDPEVVWGVVEDEIPHLTAKLLTLLEENRGA